MYEWKVAQLFASKKYAAWCSKMFPNHWRRQDLQCCSQLYNIS